MESNLPGNCMQIKGRRYTVNTIAVSPDRKNLNVIIPKNTNSFMVENYGTAIAYANNRPLLPPPAAGLSGESWGVDGNDGDCFDGPLTISFDNTGTPLVWISFYIYLQ